MTLPDQIEALAACPFCGTHLRKMSEELTWPDQWPLGTQVYKRSGSNWHGRVVGYYSTSLTPRGYCIESERETGSVQIYPENALVRTEP